MTQNANDGLAGLFIAACKAHGFGFPTSTDFLFLLVGYSKVPKAKGAPHLMTPQNFLAPLTRKWTNSWYLNSQDVLISDLNDIVSIINNLTRDFERIVEDFERNTPPLWQCNQRLFAVTRSGLVCRPRLQVLAWNLAQCGRFSLGWRRENSWDLRANFAPS